MSIRDFFRPKRCHSNRDVRLDAIRHLTESVSIDQVPGSEPDVEIQAAAVLRLTDFDLLKAFTYPNQPSQVCKAAISQIADRTFRKGMIEKGRDSQLISAVARRSAEIDRSDDRS